MRLDGVSTCADGGGRDGDGGYSVLCDRGSRSRPRKRVIAVRDLSWLRRCCCIYSAGARLDSYSTN
jgi:hypothetical protein